MTFESCLETLGERARHKGVDSAVVASVLAATNRLERVIDLDYDGVLVGGQYGEFAAMTPDDEMPPPSSCATF